MKFVPPTSLEEAETRRRDAVNVLHDINIQLSNKNRLIHGRRATDDEYHDWRFKALTAKRHAEFEVQQLKAWLLKARAQSQAAIHSNGPISTGDRDRDMLYRAFRLLVGLRSETDFTTEELAEFDAIGHYIDHERPTT